MSGNLQRFGEDSRLRLLVYCKASEMSIARFVKPSKSALLNETSIGGKITWGLTRIHF